jgi:hypothetical protein
MAEAHKQLLVDNFLCFHQLRRAIGETLTIVIHARDKQHEEDRTTVRSEADEVRTMTQQRVRGGSEGVAR